MRDTLLALRSAVKRALRVHRNENDTMNGILGIVRIDYKYDPMLGDIDHPDSFTYPVKYKIVSDLTFETCKSGNVSDDVKRRFEDAITALAEMGASVIAGDCGFMLRLQSLARRRTKLPVIMSSLCLLPTIVTSYAEDEQIAIVTASKSSLMSMMPLVRTFCNVDVSDRRFIVVGCDDVPGFDAIDRGDPFDTELVRKGVVELAERTFAQHPGVRCFVFECTQLPPFSDATRARVGLPVFDVIDACNTFMASVRHKDTTYYDSAPYCSIETLSPLIV